MKFEIRNRWTQQVQFTAEIECAEDTPLSIKLRLAVQWGIEHKANLCAANLCAADLCEANLREADLCAADLRAADLRAANLREANLRVANLCEADLREADLCAANLCAADLCEAKGIERFPIGVSGHKHFLQTTQDGQLQIGCHTHTFEEWIENAEQIGKKENYSPLDIEIYKLHIQHIAQVSRLLWNKEVKKEVDSEVKE